MAARPRRGGAASGQGVPAWQRRTQGKLRWPVTRYPDFQFVQMVSPPEMVPPDWEPAFTDYLYLAFTNAAAFSPTDVLPMSRWAKLGMTVQSIISIVTVALVVSRAVNILPVSA